MTATHDENHLRWATIVHVMHYHITAGRYVVNNVVLHCDRREGVWTSLQNSPADERVKIVDGLADPLGFLRCLPRHQPFTVRFG